LKQIFQRRSNLFGDDSAMNPSKMRIGRMTELLLDDTFCRTVVFDHKSAQTTKDKVELCDESVRYSNGGSKSHFNWSR
jgi:hypothetical protein